MKRLLIINTCLVIFVNLVGASDFVFKGRVITGDCGDKLNAIVAAKKLTPDQIINEALADYYDNNSPIDSEKYLTNAYTTEINARVAKYQADLEALKASKTATIEAFKSLNILNVPDTIAVPQ